MDRHLHPEKSGMAQRLHEAERLISLAEFAAVEAQAISSSVVADDHPELDALIAELPAMREWLGSARLDAILQRKRAPRPRRRHDPA